MSLDVLDQVEDPSICSHCKSTENVQMCKSMTNYYQEPDTRYQRAVGERTPDPNRDIPLCPMCTEEYQVYWSSMWAEYYSSLL